ncbi:MAG: hypothetical protein ACLU4N_06645 [Butyricimonas faecihominis]
MRRQEVTGEHNGLKSINQLLGTQITPVCVSVSGTSSRKQVDYVLGEWSSEEEERFPAMLKHCGEVIENFIFIGVDKTMSLCNNLRF